jgi:hypothetical protein
MKGGGHRWISLKALLYAVLMLVFGSCPGPAQGRPRHPGWGTPVPPTEKFNPGKLIMEHIADAHTWHLWGHTSLPLPVILWDG